MIRIRKSSERLYERHGKREVWLTFYPQDQLDALANGFGTIVALDEERLLPGADVSPHPPYGAEFITYVHEGAIDFEDSEGRSGVIQAGEFQRLSPGRGRDYREKNESLTNSSHVFRIWLRSSNGEGEPGCEQKRFSVAELRGRLCVIASPDGRRGSLRIHQDALIFSAILLSGHHVIHELCPERMAWIHVVQGEVALGEHILTTGDGAGFTTERAVSLTARKETAILLVDAGEGHPCLPENRVAEREHGSALGPANLRGRGGLDQLPEREPASKDSPASGTALFKMLWDSLVDVLGPATTATIVRRASRRALPQSAELGDLVITRVNQEYTYIVPRSFDQTVGPPAALLDLLGEIRPLLTQLTGQVVLRHLDKLPELREWANLSPRDIPVDRALAL